VAGGDADCPRANRAAATQVGRRVADDDDVAPFDDQSELIARPLLRDGW